MSRPSSLLDNSWKIPLEELNIPDITLYIQAGILILLGVNAFLTWTAIIEAYMIKNNQEARFIKYSILCPILIFIIIPALSAYGLTSKVSPIFVELLVYLVLVHLPAVIPIFSSEKIRSTLMREIPLLNRFVSNNKRLNSHRTFRNYISSPNEDYVRLAVVESNLTSVRTNIMQTSREEPQRAITISREKHFDKDYQNYLDWSSKRTVLYHKLTYEEFSRIRETVDSILHRRIFGMSRDDELDIISLSLLARLEAREDVEKISTFGAGKYFRKLRRLGLVSERGKLMPKGLKLVKALRKEGLLEELRYQTK